MFPYESKNIARINTDGKATFSDLSNDITLKSEKINYDEDSHRLKWLNIISRNIKNNITGIYHGVTKSSLPLFLHEQEWRFNHRNSGKSIMEKVSKYITKSFPISLEKLSEILELSKSYFSTCA
ncbi:transposase [Coprobacillus cateniformis]|uniref:transposase n=1 Tax=Coprobacillus cateniformis TaxID=100884 RepID=UPI000A03D9DD